MRYVLIATVLTIIPFIRTFPQNETNPTSNSQKKYIHIETGYIYPEGKIKENISIRQNLNYYSVVQYSDGYISSETSGLFFGARYEYYLPKIKSGISSGLRFVGFDTEISGYISNNSDFFYLRYSFQDSETKFARVKSLTENNYLLSVPLELRFIPLQYKKLSFYVKAGVEYSIANLKNKTDIKFQNEAMNVHKDEILGKVSSPTSANYSTFYSSVGCSLGQEGKTNYSIEIFLPSTFLTRNNFSLIDTDYFAGFKISLQFPVKNNKHQQ